MPATPLQFACWVLDAQLPDPERESDSARA